MSLITCSNFTAVIPTISLQYDVTIKIPVRTIWENSGSFIINISNHLLQNWTIKLMLRSWNKIAMAKKQQQMFTNLEGHLLNKTLCWRDKTLSKSSLVYWENESAILKRWNTVMIVVGFHNWHASREQPLWSGFRLTYRWWCVLLAQWRQLFGVAISFNISH